MTYRLPAQGTRVVALLNWFSHTILVMHPDLQRLNQIRIAIDRQTVALDGQVLNERDQPLATFSMQCRALTDEELSVPKL